MKFKSAKKIKQKNKKKIKSPRNSLSFPAFVKTSAGKPASFKISLPKISSIKFFRIYHKSLNIFIIFIFILATIIVGLDLQKNIAEKNNIESERKQLQKELVFWKDLISKYENYRDAYFKVSILEYKLGNISLAKEYVEKGLALDPNSIDGKRIEDFLSQ